MWCTPSVPFLPGLLLQSFGICSGPIYGLNICLKLMSSIKLCANKDSFNNYTINLNLNLNSRHKITSDRLIDN